MRRGPPERTPPHGSRARAEALAQQLQDAQEELRTLRVYTARLADELLRLNPKALARAAMPFM